MTNSVALDAADDTQHYAASRSSLRAWAETIALSCVAVGASFLLSPTAGFVESGQSFWVALAPLLIGLQHGFTPALGSAALVLAGVHLREPFADWTSGSAPGTLIASLAVGTLTGLFADRWRRRDATARTHAAEQHERVAELERDCQLLRLSHADLEQRLAGGTWSVATCMHRLDRRMAEARSLDALAQAVLDFLLGQASVHSASFYYVGAEGLPERAAAATLGNAPPNAHSNAVVQRTLETRKVAALRDVADGDTSVLAAAPLVSRTGHLRAVVAIHAMPFLALHHDHLAKIGVLCARLADSLDLRISAMTGPASSVSAEPGATPTAALEPAAQESGPLDSAERDSGVVLKDRPRPADSGRVDAA